MTSKKWGSGPAPYLLRFSARLRTDNWRGRSRRVRKQRSTFSATLVRKSEGFQAIEGAADRRSATTRLPAAPKGDCNILSTIALSYGTGEARCLVEYECKVLRFCANNFCTFVHRFRHACI